MTKGTGAPFGPLKYLYIGTANVQKDLDYYTKILGAKKAWDLSSFGTRVAALRLGKGPLLLLADHRPAPSCILIFQVDNLEATSRSSESEVGLQREEGSRFRKALVIGSMIRAATRSPFSK